MTHATPLLLAFMVVLLIGSLAFAGGTVTITPAPDGNESSQGGGGDQYEAQGVTLAKALQFLAPEKIVIPEKSDLPAGRFNITISGYPIRQQPAFDALVAEISKQFKVDVSVVEEERDGYNVSVAPDSPVKKSDTEEGLYFTSSGGWTFKACSIKMIAEFLSKELSVPVDSTGPTDAYYTFDLKVSVFKPEQLPEALEKAGFVVAKQKVKQKTLKATKSE